MAHCFACACVSWMQEETYPRKGRRCLHLFTEFTVYIYHLSAIRLHILWGALCRLTWYVISHIFTTSTALITRTPAQTLEFCLYFCRNSQVHVGRNFAWRVHSCIWFQEI
jgi:hypothetical protein